VLLGWAGAAGAADLDYNKGYDKEPYAPYYYHRDEPRPEKYYERRGEPRYWDERRYAEPYVERNGRAYDNYNGRYSHYDDRYVPAPRDSSRYDDRGCLTRGEIRYRLREHGWTDFHDLETRSDVALVNARRPDGLLYRLSVDRCTGVIVNARLLDEGRGWRQGSRPYGYSY
jgi:hypothetical protein